MPKSLGTVIHRNLANVVSVLGVMPLCLLFLKDGYQYLLPLIVYNNIMDDLDGILAVKLGIKSAFGNVLDNVCDAVSHIVFVMVVGMHVLQDGAIGHSAGLLCAAASLLAASAIMLRVVTRLTRQTPPRTGSPTNELIRHLLFVLLLADHFEFHPVPLLLAAFTLHSASMLVPFTMDFLIRYRTSSATAIGLLNVALVVAYLLPDTTPIIAACFVSTYLFSFAAGGTHWLKRATAATTP